MSLASETARLRDLSSIFSTEVLRSMANGGNRGSPMMECHCLSNANFDFSISSINNDTNAHSSRLRQSTLCRRLGN